MIVELLLKILLTVMSALWLATLAVLFVVAAGLFGIALIVGIALKETTKPAQQSAPRDTLGALPSQPAFR